MKKTDLLVIVFLNAPAFGAWAQPTLWDVQFSYSYDYQPTQTGAAVIGNSGDQWNLCASAGSGAQTLFDSTGASGSVSISWNANGAYAPLNAPGYYGFYGTADSSLMDGYILATGSDTITVSGLADFSNYTIDLYTQGDFTSSGRALSVTTDLGTYTSSPTVATASTFVEGQNYLVVSAETDASGTLDLTYAPTAGGEADVNGLQITGASPVPEPSSFALVGLGGFLAWLNLKRRK